MMATSRAAMVLFVRITSVVMLAYAGTDTGSKVTQQKNALMLMNAKIARYAPKLRFVKTPMEDTTVFATPVMKAICVLILMNAQTQPNAV